MEERKLGCLGSIMNTFGLLPKGDYDTGEIIPYAKRDDFLSKAEFSFYKVLNNVLNEQEYIICPKVSLMDLFFVTDTKKESKMTYINKINRKHVDFLVCNQKNMNPIFAIELDDSSHNKSSRIARDEFVDKVFKAAGVPLIRFKVKLSYIPSELTEKIELELRKALEGTTTTTTTTVRVHDNNSKICPQCGSEMKLKTAKSGKYKGKNFYGCGNYPKCNEIINIED